MSNVLKSFGNGLHDGFVVSLYEFTKPVVSGGVNGPAGVAARQYLRRIGEKTVVYSLPTHDARAPEVVYGDADKYETDSRSRFADKVGYNFGRIVGIVPGMFNLDNTPYSLTSINRWYKPRQRRNI